MRCKYNGSYTYCSIHIVGDSPGYGPGFHGTVLRTDFDDKPALILQSARAIKVENIVFQGKNNWTALSGRDPGNMATHHKDDDHNYLASPSVRDNRFSPHAGIHIDPYNQAVLQIDRYPGLENEYINSGTGAGSSAVCIQNCEFRDFVVGVGISLNGTTQNAENITLVDCSFESMKSAIAIGQDQSRNITVYNVVIYGAKIAFDCTSYGKGTGNCPSIFGADIGGVKYIFHTFSFGSGASINGLYSESIYSMGTLGGGGAHDGYVFNGCAFNFVNSPQGKGAIVYRLVCVDGTATFSVPNKFDGLIAHGDFIWAFSKNDFYPLDRPYDKAPTSIVLGKVATVTATQAGIQVVLAYVPKIVTKDTIHPTETIRLFVIYLPHVHPPTTGKIDFLVSSTKIITSNGGCFSQYERIRDRQGCILEGTFIVNRPDFEGTGTIQLSRPATKPANGSDQMTLDLYDADVREINMTPVF